MTQYQTPEIIPAWAEAGDKNDIPTNAEVQEGWPQTNTPPTRQRFNWLLNWLSRGVRSWMQMGLPTWSEDEDYPQWAKVLDPHTGKTYQAKRANTGMDPENSPDDWERWGYSASDPNIDNVPTPPLFDNDNTVSNTEFVNRNGLFSPIAADPTVNTAMVNTHLGGVVAFRHAAVTRNYTLLAANAVPAGRGVWVCNRCSDTTGTVLIQTASTGDIISTVGPVANPPPWGDANVSLSLLYGERVFLRSNGNNSWEALIFDSRRGITLDATVTGNYLATLDAIDARINALFVGSLKLVAHNDAPEAGYLQANGAAVSRTTYASLFNKITVSVTASNIAGQNTLTGVPAAVFNRVQLNMPISGPGIQAGTTISGTNPGGNTLTLSLVTTSGGSGQVYCVCPWGVGDGSTTFNLPEYRGEFIRGFDAGRNVDAGRVFATLQAHALLAHSHTMSTDPSGSTQARSGTGGSAFNNAGVLQYLGNDASGNFPLYASSVMTPGGNTETRPRNQTAQVLIKY